MENLHAQPDTLASDRLQVMTIYSAKGLQFDTVILPGLNRGTGADKGKLLHWFELAGQNRIVMSPMRNAADRERQKTQGDLIQFISDVEKRRQRLETGRLLYVATTRAISSLHLFAAVKPQKNGSVKAAAGTLLGELWPAIEVEQTPLINLAAGEGEQAGAIETGEEEVRRTSNTPSLPQHYRRLTADWQPPRLRAPCGETRPAFRMFKIALNSGGQVKMRV